ncbi:hypothetical protein ACFO4O_15050 [Glaciecola siphonariae]|uniref:Uncharacterized protein n=1 Tax=Glaciecola siphonariae TaxID=521012 RepID=A0ABV9LYA6_9ALTE
MTDFSKKCLTQIFVDRRHKDVHQAWQDHSNKGFHICYEVNLVFSDKSVFIIKPSEVEIEGRYPALGLSVEQEATCNVSTKFEVSELPMTINCASYSDYLGEDADNEITLRFEHKLEIAIRHVFPPMTLGIKVRGVDA